jgi:hypothetical protein
MDGVTKLPFFPDDSLWITDIAAAVKEQAALSYGTAQSKDRWQVFAYETLSAITGRMVYAAEVGNHDELTLPLPGTGWFRIYLGLASSLPGFLLMSMGIQARLGSDPAFYKLNGYGSNWFWEMTDNLWKEAYLEDETLHFRNGAKMQSSLAWVRLEPMTAAEIAAAERRLKKTNPHTSITTNDAGWPNTLEDFYSTIIPFRESNVKKIFFDLAEGDTCQLLPTQVGTVPAGRDGDHMRQIDLEIGVALDQLRQEHPDAIAKLADFTHRLGLEFHASIRTGAMYLPGWHGNSNFFLDHPGYHCMNRDGSRVTRLSFAAPEVRAHLLALLSEMLTYDVDGLNLIFIRALPAMLFELPFVTSFQAAHGQDPRQLPEDDLRIPEHRATVMTAFIRQVRALLDTAGEHCGRRLELSITAPATKNVNLFHGLDLRRWAQDGLIDQILADSSLQDRFHSENLENIDYPYFKEVCAGTACAFYPKMIGIGEPEKILPYYQRALAAGASGFFLWDGTVNYASYPRGWEYLHLLGDADTSAAEAALRRRPPESRLHLLKTLAGYDYSQYPPHVSY